jgi:BMFP domain-containing protein YqiC
MTEYIWPTVIAFGMLLLFIRTRPKSLGEDLAVLARLKLREHSEEIEALKKVQADSAPKQLVDRMNVVSKEMVELVKPALISHAERLAQLEMKMTRLDAAKAAKAIAGVRAE